MRRLHVFQQVGRSRWWRALAELESALARTAADQAALAYSALVGELVAQRLPSPAAAAARQLLDGEEWLADGEHGLPPGLEEAALGDLATIQAVLRRDWRSEAERLLQATLPPLRELARPRDDAADWAERLLHAEPGELLSALLRRYAERGVGVLARHLAFRWSSGRLEGVHEVGWERLEDLVGLERQTALLQGNVEAFLAGLPAQPMLLYGPRGSGKSTALRALLPRYAERGLRLVELSPALLPELPQLAQALRRGRHRYLLFVDDLAFEAGDRGYQPLKSLLEGSVAGPPQNVLLAATSNRRHLLRESFGDRPDPLDEDVHAWDTQHERLALADRFPLVITFPSADQRRYLEIVSGLAERHGIAAAGLAERALRYAEWGNGYSGRTARQFINRELVERGSLASGR